MFLKTDAAFNLQYSDTQITSLAVINFDFMAFH